MDKDGSRRRAAKGRSKSVPPSLVASEASTATPSAPGTEDPVTPANPTHDRRDAAQQPAFPAEGWSHRSADLPHGVSVGVVLLHLQSRGKHLMTQKPFRRGHEFFFWSYVHGVECCSPDAKNSGPQRHFVKAKCWASQRKKESYRLKCVLQRCVSMYQIEVISAYYTCTAGIAGSCHHIVALLLTYNYCEMKGQGLPSAGSATSQQQQWGPRPRSVVAKPVMDVTVERASTNR